MDHRSLKSLRNQLIPRICGFKGRSHSYRYIKLLYVSKVLLGLSTRRMVQDSSHSTHSLLPTCGRETPKRHARRKRIGGVLHTNFNGSLSIFIRGATSTTLSTPCTHATCTSRGANDGTHGSRWCSSRGGRLWW